MTTFNHSLSQMTKNALGAIRTQMINAEEYMHYLPFTYLSDGWLTDAIRDLINNESTAKTTWF